MDNEILDLEKQVQEKQKQEVQLFNSKPQQAVVEKPVDKNQELMNNVFNQAIVDRVMNDADTNANVLKAAKTYVDTSMQTISTDVDTKYKEAVFVNNKDACESYGFNEKTTPTWAVRLMKAGYSVMLAVYLVVASFTVMPVIFLMKKIQVAVKHTWIAIVLAFLIYAAIVFSPIIIGFIKR